MNYTAKEILKLKNMQTPRRYSDDILNEIMVERERIESISEELKKN